MKKNIAALTVGSLLLLSSPATAGEGWIEDFDEAVKIAKAENKDLFVDFTGSDWCGWCIKLHDEVFQHEEFSTAIKKDYVLVYLDFPRKEENIAKVPNMTRNRELQQKYGVRGFPTIMLMNSAGVAYAQTGYQPGGPEEYVKHIAELRKNREKLEVVEKAVAAYEQASAEQKTAALEGLLDTLVAMDAGSSLAAMLFDHARSAFEIDPKNEKGLKLKAVHGLAKAGQWDAELAQAAKEVDGKNTHGALEILVQAQFQKVRDGDAAKAAIAELDALNELGFKDSALGFELNFTAAGWAAGPMSDPALAAGYADKAKAIGPPDPKRAEFLDKLIERIEQEKGGL